MSRKIDLDVTDFLEPIHIKAGDYEFDLPPDIPTTLITRLSATREAALKGENSMEGAVETLDSLYEAFADLMEGAVPPPPKPVREMFTQPAVLSIIYFLLSDWGKKTESSMSSLQSPTSSAGRSASQSSSQVTGSTVVPPAYSNAFPEGAIPGPEFRDEVVEERIEWAAPER